MRGRRWGGCAGWSVDDGDGIGVSVGRIFDIGIARDEGLRILLDAVLFLVLRLLLLVLLGVAVELALVLLVFGDARLRAVG